MLVHVRFELVPGLFSGDLFSILLILYLDRTIGMSVAMSVPW